MVVQVHSEKAPMRCHVAGNIVIFDVMRGAIVSKLIRVGARYGSENGIKVVLCRVQVIRELFFKLNLDRCRPFRNGF